MRLFYFVFVLSQTFSFALACDENDFLQDGGTVSCPTGLQLNAPVSISRNTLTPSSVIFLDVTGDVVINHNISINGANGATQSSANGDGGAGGPGAADGGGILLGDGQPSTDYSNYSVFPPSTALGQSHPTNGVCNHGGGGGGFSNAGQDGIQCPTGPLPVGIGGTSVPGVEFDFASLFRGGFGGGAGGAFDLGSGNYDVGSGGGGGGALHIRATGTITIASGVTISARGGNGGNAVNLGGAGAGGSGGAIWLEASGGIINNGTIDTRGGSGGQNTRGSAPQGGNGGLGSDGPYRLDNAGSVTNGSGIYTPTPTTGPGPTTPTTPALSPKLSSDISCGVISDKNQSSFFLSMMAGVLLSIMYAFLPRLKKYL